MCIFHDWSKWTEAPFKITTVYKDYNPTSYWEHGKYIPAGPKYTKIIRLVDGQKRECLRCGKQELREVKI